VVELDAISARLRQPDSVALISGVFLLPSLPRPIHVLTYGSLAANLRVRSAQPPSYRTHVSRTAHAFVCPFYPYSPSE